MEHVLICTHAHTSHAPAQVWSLLDKKRNKQMFFNNPAHQPNNIGYRKAWTAGGCEWNWAPGKIGHSVFSEAPVWTAVLPTERGPVVRVWEYDRLNSSVWQVDMLFEDDVMYAHAKITNPTATNTSQQGSQHSPLLRDAQSDRPRVSCLVSTSKKLHDGSAGPSHASCRARRGNSLS